MHKLFAIIVTALAVNASADVIDSRARNFMNSRRICVRRDCTTLPGYCIEYWERNGKPDTKLPAVVTNKLYAVAGEKQNNPLENEVQPLRNVKKAAKKAQKNLEKVVKTIEKARDKSSTDEERALYQSLLDILNVEG